MPHPCTFLVTATLAAGLAFAGPAAAQYPDKPVELIVPYAPGGASDILARSVAPHLQQALGTSIVVVNRAGANTAIAATQLARSAPDGYTIMLGDVALLLNDIVRKSSPGYDAANDFTPVSLLGKGPFVLYVPAGGSADLNAFLAQGRESGLNIANSGAGSLGHLAGELLQLRTPAKITNVPYRGAGPAMNEVIGGQVDAIFGSTTSGMGLVGSGQLKALAVASPEPIPDYPTIPTFASLGVEGMNVINWWGIIGPAGLPADVVKRLSDALAQVMQQPAILERFSSLGVTPSLLDSEAYGELMRHDMQLWQDVVQRAGIQLD